MDAAVAAFGATIADYFVATKKTLKLRYWVLLSSNRLHEKTCAVERSQKIPIAENYRADVDMTLLLALICMLGHADKLPNPISRRFMPMFFEIIQILKLFLAHTVLPC